MKKDIVAVFAVVLAIAVLISGTEFQSVDEYYLTHIDDITPESDTVFITVDCRTILDNYDDLDTELRSEKYVPADGMILKKTEYVLRPGDTVFDILSRALRYNKIQLEYQGADKNGYKSVYIQGINYLYEFSCGPLSGWMFKVNGEFPSSGCSKYQLKDGDSIEWLYTCSIGHDIGSEYNGESFNNLK